MSPSVSNVLEFLQSGLESGLAYNSLRVQVSAILANHRWAFDPLIFRFLKAAMKIRPPMRSYFPKWDLTLVLKALINSLFDSASSCSLFHLTLRTVFLMGIASARKVSELCALSVREPYCLILPDKIVLRPVPSYLPKISMTFHIIWESVLPAFISCSMSSQALTFLWACQKSSCHDRLAKKY